MEEHHTLLVGIALFGRKLAALHKARVDSLSNGAPVTGPGPAANLPVSGPAGAPGESSGPGGGGGGEGAYDPSSVSPYSSIFA